MFVILVTSFICFFINLNFQLSPLPPNNMFNKQYIQQWILISWILEFMNPIISVSVYPWIHVSIYPSIHVSIYHVSMNPCFFLSMYLCIYVSMYPGFHISVYSFIHLSMYPCIRLSIYPCIHVSMYLCIQVFMYPCIYVSRYPFIHVLEYPFIHLYMYQSMCIRITCIKGLYSYSSTIIWLEMVAQLCIVHSFNGLILCIVHSFNGLILLNLTREINYNCGWKVLKGVEDFSWCLIFHCPPQLLRKS